MTFSDFRYMCIVHNKSSVANPAIQGAAEKSDGFKTQ
jgi:hypothetical protein